MRKAVTVPALPIVERPCDQTDHALAVLYPAVVSTAIKETPSGDTFSLAQKFISNLRVHTSNIKREVLDLMAREGEVFISEQRQIKNARMQEEATLRMAMQSVVEESFAAIEPYAAELNYVLGVTDLHVSVTPPSWVTEDAGKYRSSERKSFYRARISTSRLSAVIRGSNNTVDFFLLPATVVMGLSQVEDQFKPLMRFTAIASGAFIDWQVEGKPLTAERLEKYCVLLFNYLLEQTKTEVARSA